jgi:hypothetical protein
VLGDSQWSQIDESIKTALEKHPEIVRYFVCIPLDRADARIEGKKSAKDRWDTHTKKWTGWASDRGMTVEFVYWGSHELIERLSRPEHVGRLRFWFDVRGFDKSWFSSRVDEAVNSAGPRYTRELNIALPIAAEFEAFGRTEQFFDQVKARARPVRDKYRSFNYPSAQVGEPAFGAATARLSSSVETVLAELKTITPEAVGPLPFRKIAEIVSATEVAATAVEQQLLKLEREHDVLLAPKDGSGSRASHKNPYSDLRTLLFALQSALRKTRGVLEHAAAVAGRALMLLTGVAGTGKTHLLCDVARERIAAGKPTVLLMGQQFMSTGAPWPQALQHLDLTGLSAEEFVGSLEAAAQTARCRALVIIDAINEGAGRLIWPSHLITFGCRHRFASVSAAEFC